MMQVDEFTVRRHDDGHLEVEVGPRLDHPVAFSLGLLADIANDMTVDRYGRLVVLGMTFALLRFDSGSDPHGPPQSIICRRVL
jgi:hypothetical protein